VLKNNPPKIFGRNFFGRKFLAENSFGRKFFWPNLESTIFRTGGVDDKNIQKSLVCYYCTKIFCVFFKEPKKSGIKSEFFLYVP